MRVPDQRRSSDPDVRLRLKAPERVVYSLAEGSIRHQSDPTTIVHSDTTRRQPQLNGSLPERSESTPTYPTLRIRGRASPAAERDDHRRRVWIDSHERIIPVADDDPRAPAPNVPDIAGWSLPLNNGARVLGGLVPPVPVFGG